MSPEPVGAIYVYIQKSVIMNIVALILPWIIEWGALL